MSWDLIIRPIVDLLLAKCFQNLNPQQTPQVYLRSKYNPATSEFDAKLMRDTARQVRRADQKAKRQASKADRKAAPKYGQEDYRSMAYDHLMRAMSASDSEVKTVMAVARAFPDMMEGNE